MSSRRPELKLAFCSAKAARYACENWHYSGRQYVNKTIKIGVWEDGEFKGVIVFGTGCQYLSKPYKLKNTQVCELVRVALKEHSHSVSRMISIALKLLVKSSPKLKLVVSFADSAQGHHGGIYQACNWIYCGSVSTHEYEVLGKRVPPRTLHNRYGKGGQSIQWLKENIDPTARRVHTPPKHRYLYPLDKEMREQILPLAKPYPKRAGSKDNVASTSQVEEGGVSPTPALQL